MTPVRIRASLALVLVAIIWGAALPITKPALEFISPIEFLFLRYTLAVACILPMFIYLGYTQRYITHEIRYIIAAAILNAIALILLYSGLDRSSALEASLMTSTAPVIVTLFGIFILKEHETSREWLGLGIAVIGTLCIIIGPQLQSIHQTRLISPGNLLIVAFIIIDSTATLLVKRKVTSSPRSHIVMLHTITAFLFYFFYHQLSHAPSPLESLIIPTVLLSVVYMGIIGTIVAFALVFYGYQRIEASEAVLFTYLQPLVFIPLSVIWLGETIIPLQLIGLILILAGVVLAEVRYKHVS